MFARIGDLFCRCVKNGHQYVLVSRHREAEKYGLKKEGKVYCKEIASLSELDEAYDIAFWAEYETGLENVPNLCLCTVWIKAHHACFQEDALSGGCTVRMPDISLTPTATGLPTFFAKLCRMPGKAYQTSGSWAFLKASHTKELSAPLAGNI